MPLFYGLLLIIVLIVFYSFSMAENRNTAVPEGCQELLAHCSSCHDVTCGHYEGQGKEI